MKIGLTTSLPIEVIYASNNIPIDLNNILVSGNAEESVAFAEKKGFPRNICAWIKGLYTIALESGIDELIGVVEGDCSNTHSLMSVLKSEGISVSSFSFPYNRDRASLKREIESFAAHYNVKMEEVKETKKILDKIRKKLIKLDELTYLDNKVTGFENHLWLVSSSDFNSDYQKFDSELTQFLLEAERRAPRKNELRIAFLGVPPIITDIYDTLEELGARVVYNEVQRQFAMPYLETELVDQYLRYTYPYNVEFRLEDILLELEKREIDAVISYTQSFCHRQIDNILLKKHIKLPILVLEGDRPGKLDERSKLRIESFLEMLEG
jgi:benzoyl-CoA reductase/2-hydroxyglutaryl-CoA dehydratase subunit BcrC/BadD/HgdB